MHAVKANEILKTIEKRGPFFAFDEINENTKAHEHLFELQDIDGRIAKQSIAFHNARNDREKVDAWRLLLANFDEFRRTLYYLKSELVNYNAIALVDGIWGDCLGLCNECKKQKPNKTRCFALNNISNLSCLLVRCCTKDVVKCYQDSIDKAWQDVLKDNE